MYAQLKKRRSFLKGRGFPAEGSRAIAPGEDTAEAGGKGLSDSLRKRGAASGEGFGGGPGISTGDEDDAKAGRGLAETFRQHNEPKSETGEGPGIDPGDQTDEFAGDENPFSGAPKGENAPGGIRAGSGAQKDIGVGEEGMKTSSFTSGARHERAHAMAQHHQALADHFRKQAASPSSTQDAHESYGGAHEPGAGSGPADRDAYEESSEHEAQESPEVEALEHAHDEGHPGTSISGEGRDTKTIGDGGKNLGHARDLAQEEAEDVGEAGAKRKAGGSLRNSRGSYEKPESKFARMARGR
jgi:hypothetical protein